MIASALTDENRFRYDLNSLSWHYLGYGKNGNSGLGSQWSVTGNAGIYKEKSDYEKELDEERFEQNKEEYKSNSYSRKYGIKLLG